MEFFIAINLYQLIKLGFHLGYERVVEFIIRFFGTMFVIAFQMSVPVVATLFLVDVALGIMARTVPQLNIFVVGFPVKMVVSFIVLIVVMSMMMVVVSKYLRLMIYCDARFNDLLGGA